MRQTNVPVRRDAILRRHRTKRKCSKDGYAFLRNILDSIENLPEIREMLDAIVRSRRNGRPGYQPNSMLRLFCLKYLLAERFNVQLLQRLGASPALLDICGLDTLPSESTMSRFFRRLTEHSTLSEAIARMVERLRLELPDMGRILSIDGTDIEAYGNRNRNPRIDEDATDGYRTPKSKVRQGKSEPYYGYKMIMLADAVHDVPLYYRLYPANTSENIQLPPIVREAQETHEWLKPDYLIADRGYDSVANHQFLVKRGIAPIIHIRRTPQNGGLHDGIYTTIGAPTCLGGMEMTYVRTDRETGKHLYRCPAGGCDRLEKSVFNRCDDSHWEDPMDNLRVIGIVPRQSKTWRDLYRKRQGVERYFSSAKRSRLLDKHQYLTMRKVETHVALSVLTYLATMYARIKAGDAGRMRQMRIRV